MGKPYRVYQVDSFTKNRFHGNPAGVVAQADGLTAAQMQAIAREMNNSETAFLLSPESSDHEVRVRFFTPTVEVPSCGHATVAAHYVRAVEMNLPTSTVMHKIGIGVLPVDIEKQRDGDYEIVMTQGRPEFLDLLQSRQIDVLLSGLGVRTAEIDDRAPVQIVSTGHSKVLVGLQNVNTLLGLKPDFTRLQTLSEEIGCSGYYVFVLQDAAAPAVARARMFAPAIGINEDPVNGNGSGPLGAYLVNYGLADHDGRAFELKSFMGEVVGRPGTVHIAVTIQDGKPVQVKVGGAAVVAFETEIEV
jgi:PhzF family phenazine biosynthesis protein